MSRTATPETEMCHCISEDFCDKEQLLIEWLAKQAQSKTSQCPEVEYILLLPEEQKM